MAERTQIGGIPALVWGEPSDRVCLCVHGKMSCKESAENIGRILSGRGCQTLSFDLPQHGERQGEARRCDIWNGVADLTTVGDYVFDRWKNVTLYACSLGAYFSLHAYADRPFQKALLQSPVLDMEFLIRQMFLWFGISEERLRQEQEIDTPIDLMTWAYFQYVLAHPVTRWNPPTSILYGGKDHLQSLEVIEQFARRFGAAVTLSPHSEHPFMKEADEAIVQRWLEENL